MTHNPTNFSCLKGLFVFLITIWSCDKEPDPIKLDCRIRTLQDGSFTQVFNYNLNGFITSIDYTYNSTNSTTLIEYDQSNKISKMTSSTNRFSDFDYPGDNIILETMHIRSNPSEDYYTIVYRYEFNSDGLLLKMIDTASANYYKRYEYDSNQNLFKVYSTNMGLAGEKLTSENLSWDSKKSPDIHFSTVISLVGNDPEIYTTFNALPIKHNLLHAKTYNANGIAADLIYSYEYNSSDYPMKIDINSRIFTLDYVCE